jgi:hypothetical protein
MARARRDRGDGSIFLSGGRWRAYLTLDNGRRKYVTGSTRGEVQRKLRDAQRAAERGADLLAERMTVADWCARWVSSREIAVTTLSKCETCLRLHIAPSALGRRQLSALRAEHVDDWMAELKDGGLGGARRQTRLKLLRSALKAADVRGYYQHASDSDRREAADRVGAWLRETAGAGW